MTLAEQIKQIAMNVYKSAQPVDLIKGKVLTTNPLTINADGVSLPLTEDFLILTNNVRDHKVNATVDAISVYITTKSTPTNFWFDKQPVTMHYGLKAGEAVWLLRVQSGQKYVVLDRIGGDAI